MNSKYSVVGALASVLALWAAPASFAQTSRFEELGNLPFATDYPTEETAQRLPDRRIEFRMGINLGDIIKDGRDIYGDGVNVAARLEALAEPGGICVSRVVRDQVRDKLAFSFEDMGEHQVKNITRPVRVHRIVLGEGAGPSEPPTEISTKPPLALPDKPSIAVLPFQNMSGDPRRRRRARKSEMPQDCHS